jgi:hypothetical protein
MTNTQAESLRPHVRKQIAAAEIMAKDLGVSAVAVLGALVKANQKLVPPGHVPLAEHALAYAKETGLK